MPTASTLKPVPSPKAGYIANVNAETVGRAVLLLGAGRIKTDDIIDHAVGVSGIVKAGMAVSAGDPLVILHSNDDAKLAQAEQMIAEAFEISDDPVEPKSRITDCIA